MYSWENTLGYTQPHWAVCIKVKDYEVRQQKAVALQTNACLVSNRTSGEHLLQATYIHTNLDSNDQCQQVDLMPLLDV